MGTRIPLLQSRAPTLTDGNFVLAVRQKLNEATFLMRIFGILEEKAMGIVQRCFYRLLMWTEWDGHVSFSQNSRILRKERMAARARAEHDERKALQSRGKKLGSRFQVPPRGAI